MKLYPSIYGFLISVGIYICLILAEKRVKNDGKDVTVFWNVSAVALLCGLAGARLYHVINFWNFYSVNLIRILLFWKGGLGILGAAAGGILGVKLYLSVKKQPVGYWLDLLATFVPLGQAIGRWGNFFNQENFGKPTTLPWGIFIDKQNRPTGFESFSQFHPSFFYESALDLILFFILLKLGKGLGLGKGLITAFYLLGYSIIRFGLEFIRLNPWTIHGINTAQAVCAFTAIFSAMFISKRISEKS